MKAIRTAGIIVSVALAAVALAVLPVVQEEVAPERGGIAIGEASDAGGADGPGDADAATADGGAGADTADGSGAGSDGGVALPRPSATEQPVGGVHSDTGVGEIEAESSPEPSPKPDPAPAAPTEQKPSAGGSSGESAPSVDSGTSSKPASPPRPSGVCEWDDGELECDDDDADDDEADDDDDGDDDDD